MVDQRVGGGKTQGTRCIARETYCKYMNEKTSLISGSAEDSSIENERRVRVRFRGELATGRVGSPASRSELELAGFIIDPIDLLPWAREGENRFRYFFVSTEKGERTGRTTGGLWLAAPAQIRRRGALRHASRAAKPLGQIRLCAVKREILTIALPSLPLFARRLPYSTTQRRSS